MSVFKEKAKDFASAGLNKLPDRANLFLRYMTGIGGRNLDLDDKTVSQIRDSTKESTATGEPGGRFGFEPEITAKISRIPKIRIYEVGISYYGRTFEEGKKIGWKDGVRAIYCIIKYGLLKSK